MCAIDENAVAPLVVEYYGWLSGNGGRSSDELLALPLSATQRALLLERMDDVNVVFAITSPIARGRAAGHATASRREK